jgi:hypothetical protein
MEWNEFSFSECVKCFRQILGTMNLFGPVLDSIAGARKMLKRELHRGARPFVGTQPLDCLLRRQRKQTPVIYFRQTTF